MLSKKEQKRKETAVGQLQKKNHMMTTSKELSQGDVATAVLSHATFGPMIDRRALLGLPFQPPICPFLKDTKKWEFL